MVKGICYRLDVIGVEFDNVLKDNKTGNVYRIDLGGFLEYIHSKKKVIKNTCQRCQIIYNIFRSKYKLFCVNCV